MQRIGMMATITVAAVLAVGVGISPAGESNKQSGKGGADRLDERVLIVGGGASHDFDRWFNKEDTRILEEAGAKAKYTDRPRKLPALLSKKPDVLCLTNNKPMPGKKVRGSVFDFVDGGGGLVVIHAAVWYNWKSWPRYNRELVGGGSRGHRHTAGFPVKVTKPAHPVMAGVPSEFEIVDELYHFKHDPKGSDIEVLAKGIHPENGKTWPVVWTVQRDGGRIVCTSLGHDGRAHKHEAYRALLRNAVDWANDEAE